MNLIAIKAKPFPPAGLAVLLVLAAMNTRGYAGDSPPVTAEPPAAATSLLESETLTDDWFGHGASLRDHGISLTASLTEFYGGLMSGDGSKDLKDGGKLDVFLRVDGSKIGLWQGFGLSSHCELNYGHANEYGGCAGGEPRPGPRYGDHRRTARADCLLKIRCPFPQLQPTSTLPPVSNRRLPITSPLKTTRTPPVMAVYAKFARAGHWPQIRQTAHPAAPFPKT